MDNKIWYPADTPPEEEGGYLIFTKSDISSGGSRMMVGQITFGHRRDGQWICNAAKPENILFWAYLPDAPEGTDMLIVR